jgi:hypothetical protein
VASKQTEILSHTDAALNLAAKAQTDSAQTAEKLRLFTEATERAWIGPNGAVIEGTLETGKPISTAVTYQNTGRQPAYLVITTLPTLVKRDAWNNGVGVGVLPIVLWQNKCVGGTIPPNPVNARVAYPTTGFSAYRLQVYSDDASLAQSDRFWQPTNLYLVMRFLYSWAVLCMERQKILTTVDFAFSSITKFQTFIIYRIV